MARRRPAAVVAVCAVVLACVPAPAATARGQEPAPTWVLGGSSALPEAVLDDVEAQTGRRPLRLAGADRFATSAAIAHHAHPSGVETVYLATGLDFADALAASTAVAAEDAALLLVARDAVPAAVADALVRLAPGRVRVLGGSAAVSEAVLDEVEGLLGIRPDRLAGRDRYATAVAIAQDAHPEGADVVHLATGEGFADALAASTLVVADRGPLLLVASDGFPDVVAAELARLAPRRVHVLGGRAAVADDVLAQVEAATGVRPERIAGRDRVATAEAVARRAHPDGPPAVYLATGLGFADALAAATAVAASGGALRLVNPVPRWAPDLAAAVAAAAGRSGSVRIAAIGTDGTLVGHRADEPVVAVSTLKILFLLAHLRDPAVRDRPLTAGDRDLLEPMITQSANAPASAIANRLGPGPLEALAREVGMRAFAFTRPWGSTRTSARDQALLLHALPDLLPARHRTYALDLLTRVVPDQRWGLVAGDVAPWTAHLKGGWGSGTGAATHQVVLLRHPLGPRAALAIMVTGSPSHAYGTETVRLVREALLADLP